MRVHGQLDGNPQFMEAGLDSFRAIAVALS